MVKRLIYLDITAVSNSTRNASLKAEILFFAFLVIIMEKFSNEKIGTTTCLRFSLLS